MVCYSAGSSGFNPRLIPHNYVLTVRNNCLRLLSVGPTFPGNEFQSLLMTITELLQRIDLLMLAHIVPEKEVFHYSDVERCVFQIWET